MISPTAPYQRILVLGCPGSGKTTLARQLAECSELPLLHLDDEHWGERWTRPSQQQWIDRQRELVERPCWVIDGNYLESIALRAARAELIVVLDVAGPVCLARVLRRVRRIRRGDRTQLPSRVRAAFDAEVPASADLLPLSRKILSFRSRSFWRVLAATRSNADAVVAVVTGAGRTRRSARRLRKQGSARGWAEIAVIHAGHRPAAVRTAALEFCRPAANQSS